jgi:hypothetical protein
LDFVTFAVDVIYKAGPVGCLVLFAWLWMDGRIISRGELRRLEDGHDREKQQYKAERDHARKERDEWKFMAMRGTELAKFLGEKATSP